MMPHILNQALALADRGFYVFPVKYGKKSPATAHGHNDANNDPTKIESDFGSGNFNIGIKTGPESNIVVIDDDTYKNGGTSIPVLEAKHGGLPPTLTVKTRAGGTHRYFNYPDRKIKSQNGTIAPAVDIKADGGYVLGPPSWVDKDDKGPAGTYEWANDLPIADLPQKWVELLSEKRLPVATINHHNVNNVMPETEQNIYRIKSALAWIDSDCGWEVWFMVLCALRSLNWNCSEELARSWSKGDLKGKLAIKYDEKKFDETWAPIDPNGKTTVGSLIYYAKQSGWVDPAQLASSSQDTFKDLLLEEAAPDIEEWTDPKPIPANLPDVQPFDCDALLPSTLGPFVKDISERMQCPIDYVGVSIIAAAASVIGTRFGVQVKQFDIWYEVPSFWSLIVGRSGEKKSPAMAEALGPLKAVQQVKYQEYEQSLSSYNVDMMLHKDEVTRKRKLHQTGKYVLLGSDLEEPKAPTERRYIVNDTTVESLGMILEDNPTGVLVVADEVIGLLSRLDGEERRSDRAFYLEGYNGKGSFSVDRVTRKRVVISKLCISIFGGTQPDLLRSYMRSAVLGGASNDGLIQRFQLAVYPDRLGGEAKLIDRLPDAQAILAVNTVFNTLDQLDPTSLGGRIVDGTCVIGFDASAQPAVNAWLLNLENGLRDSKAHSSLVSHYSKYRKTIPTLALVIHLAEGGQGPISLGAFQKALAWMRYLRSHAKRIYASVTAGHLDAAKSLSEKLEQGKLPDDFTVREICRRGWAGLTNKDEVALACDDLCEFGWLKKTQTLDGAAGRPTSRFRINPKINSHG